MYIVIENILQTTSSTKEYQQHTQKKRIAIIGSGVSGLTCAHYLVNDYDVTVFEANDYIGGHVNTIDVALSAKKISKKQRQQLTDSDAISQHTHIEQASIDTGFIVFNERTYPNFFRLLDELDVPFQKTDMSFSVKNTGANFEYNGHTLNSLLAQRKNVFQPKFWQFTKDILVFNKQVKKLHARHTHLTERLRAVSASASATKKPSRAIQKITKQLSALERQTLGDYLASNSYGQLFCDNYLLPMVSAIWSMGLEDSKAFPLIFFAQFFENHGLLDVVNRPQWFTLVGGSKQYVNKLVTRFADLGGHINVNSPVQSVNRHINGVTVTYQQKTPTARTGSPVNMTEQFDEVIFACHGDTAYKLLADKNIAETEVLSAFSFTDNQATLHTDTSILPKRPLAWASWNYLLATEDTTAKIKPVLTYHMNILQRLVKKHNYLVTLNSHIDTKHVIKRINYRHPVFNMHMTHAQKHWANISGHNHTHFCGAYWFNGFHEDGVKSALRVCQQLQQSHNQDSCVSILTKVQPEHLDNVVTPESLNPVFDYTKIPYKADKKQRKVAKRHVISATTNQLLNSFFTTHTPHD